jgi:hypothetical protein
MTKQLSIELLRQDLAILQGLTETEMSELSNNVKDLLAEDQEKIKAVKEQLNALEVFYDKADEYSTKFAELKCRDITVRIEREKYWSDQQWRDMYESIWSDFIDVAEACSIMKWPESHRNEKFEEYIKAYIKPLLIYMKEERPKSNSYNSTEEEYSYFISVMQGRAKGEIKTTYMESCCQKIYDLLNQEAPAG